MILLIASRPLLLHSRNFARARARRLVEQTEAHVLVGLLLLFLLLLLLLLGSSTAGGRGSSATSSNGSTAGRDGGELGGTLGDQLYGKKRVSSRLIEFAEWEKV